MVKTAPKNRQNHAMEPCFHAVIAAFVPIIWKLIKEGYHDVKRISCSGIRQEFRILQANLLLRNSWRIPLRLNLVHYWIQHDRFEVDGIR